MKKWSEMRLYRFKIQKISYPAKGDPPFPGPYPLQPRPFGPWRVFPPLSLGPSGLAHFSHPPGKKLVAPMYVHMFTG